LTLQSYAEDSLVHLKDVSVCYRVPRERTTSIKEFAIRWLKQKVTYVDLWALNHLDLDIHRGEIFGIIGSNGAGKSTLLKVIAGILHPSIGRVVVRGSVAPLLDINAGFHPELTGRENVYLFGTLLGQSHKEISASFSQIVDFAELTAFIDAPLRTYSAGMLARLGFAVATHQFADVLLVDEVLAVGDVAFQEKCLERMRDFRSRGAAILYVSHQLSSVEGLCDRAIWIERGRPRAFGSARKVVESYSNNLKKWSSKKTAVAA
jgi:ABC-2 type transport system ATP-binding protein/lipopolysaccharide transport system ATP-binding protein